MVLQGSERVGVTILVVPEPVRLGRGLTTFVGTTGPSNKGYLDSWVKRKYLDSWVKRKVEALGTDGGREIGLQTYLRPLSGA
jgi:hypothetical protein